MVIVFCLVKGSNSGFVKLESNGSSIIGRKLYTILGSKPYAAFWKIAYAEPPLGKLRFKAPRGPKYWLSETTYDYSTFYNDTCSQASRYHEDCLYLSIYMPVDSNNTNIFPVFVWIHEESNLHGPDFLVDVNIIVVTISYRTGILGFLNTEDEFATGNMGAKDIVVALNWIRHNIDTFSGDPNRVTIAGSGTAGNLVASLLLSPMADNLFSRVIIQSGSALSPADYRAYNFEIANKLYYNLNGYNNMFNRKHLYEILEKASVNTLSLASQDIFDSTEVRDSQRLINCFGPTVETIKKNAFMSESPLDIYKRKMTNNNIEVMIGYTSLEYLFKLEGFVNNKKLLKYLNYNFQYLLPFEGDADVYESSRYKRIRRKIMDFYFVNGTIGERSLRRYGKYVSDQVIYPILRQAILHTEVSCNNNVYLYRFSFKGSFNIGWNSSVGGLNWSGATVGDEICYVFRCKCINELYNSTELTNEIQFIRKIVRLLANFVKYGNPTPKAQDEILASLLWKPLVPGESLEGMSFAANLKMINVPEEKRMRFWDRLRREYFPEKLLIHEEF